MQRQRDGRRDLLGVHEAADAAADPLLQRAWLSARVRHERERVAADFRQENVVNQMIVWQPIFNFYKTNWGVTPAISGTKFDFYSLIYFCSSHTGSKLEKRQLRHRRAHPRSIDSRR